MRSQRVEIGTEPPDSFLFVDLHQTAGADDIGRQDGGKPSFDPGRRLAGGHVAGRLTPVAAGGPGAAPLKDRSGHCDR